MALLDALRSNTKASSVVELSLNPAFRCCYTALYKDIAEAELAEEAMAGLVGSHLPNPKRFPFWLLGVDVTSQPRLFSSTLTDDDELIGSRFGSPDFAQPAQDLAHASSWAR